MEASVYATEAAVEATHWWFVGRRRLFAAVIADLGIPCDAAVLDIGCGTGANLRMLHELGFRRARGIDQSPDAIGYCRQKGLGPIDCGDAARLPFPDGTFDLVLATDIIEHLDDDAAGLREVGRILRPGGRALITVPAFMALWGPHDELAHHKRRYRLRTLRQRIAAQGLAVRESCYFNWLLFLPIWASRLMIRASGRRDVDENRLNAPLVNDLLTAAFAVDVRLARALRPPFGVSILAVAEKAAATQHEGI